jgi:hypothetical protein
LECVCHVCSRHFEWEPDARFQELIDMGAGWAPPSFCSKKCYIENEEKEIPLLFQKEKDLAAQVAPSFSLELEKLQKQLDAVTKLTNEVDRVRSDAVRRNLSYLNKKEKKDWRFPDYRE